MSYFQYYDIDINAGNSVTGIITSINYNKLRADVKGIGNGIPIHYHCEELDSIPDSGRSFDQEYPNKDDKDGGFAFAVGDNVVVMYRRFNDLSPVIIGHVDGMKLCGGFSFKLSNEADEVLRADVEFKVYNEGMGVVEITNPVFNGSSGYWSFTLISNLSNETGTYWVRYTCPTYFETQYSSRLFEVNWWKEQSLIPPGSYTDIMKQDTFYFTLHAGGPDGGYLITPSNIEIIEEKKSIFVYRSDRTLIEDVEISYINGQWKLDLSGCPDLYSNQFFVAYNYDKGLVQPTQYPGRWVSNSGVVLVYEEEVWWEHDLISPGTYEDTIVCGYYGFNISCNFMEMLNLEMQWEKYGPHMGTEAYFNYFGSPKIYSNMPGFGQVIRGPGNGIRIRFGRPIRLEEGVYVVVYIKGAPGVLTTEYPNTHHPNYYRFEGEMITPQNALRSIDCGYYTVSAIRSPTGFSGYHEDANVHPICFGSDATRGFRNTIIIGNDPVPGFYYDYIPGYLEFLRDTGDRDTGKQYGWWGDSEDPDWWWESPENWWIGGGTPVGKDYDYWKFDSFQYYWSCWYNPDHECDTGLGDDEYHDEMFSLYMEYHKMDYQRPSHALYYWSGPGYTWDPDLGVGGEWVYAGFHGKQEEDSGPEPGGPVIIAKIEILSDWPKNKGFYIGSSDENFDPVTWRMRPGMTVTETWTVVSSISYQRWAHLMQRPYPGSSVKYMERTFRRKTISGPPSGTGCGGKNDPGADAISISGMGINAIIKIATYFEEQGGALWFPSTSPDGVLHVVTYVELYGASHSDPFYTTLHELNRIWAYFRYTEEDDWGGYYGF